MDEVWWHSLLVSHSNRRLQQRIQPIEATIKAPIYPWIPMIRLVRRIENERLWREGDKIGPLYLVMTGLPYLTTHQLAMTSHGNWHWPRKATSRENEKVWRRNTSSSSISDCPKSKIGVDSYNDDSLNTFDAATDICRWTMCCATAVSVVISASPVSAFVARTS